MPKLVTAIAVPTVLLALAGCGGASHDSSNSLTGGSPTGSAPVAGAAARAVGAQPIAQLVLDTRKLIRTATLDIAVKDVAVAVRAAEQAVTDAGGAVYDENVTHDGKGANEAHLTLKIPPTRYGPILDSLATSLGTEIERTQKVQDVTQDVVDVDARLDVQRRAIARVKLLLDKATKISDVVELETELSKREADYESLLTRQRTLAAQTDLATIELAIHRNDTSVLAASLNPKAAAHQGFLPGLRAGWDAFLVFGVGVLTVAGALLPFAVVAGLVAFAVLAVLRRRRATPPVEPSPAGGLVD